MIEPKRIAALLLLGALLLAALQVWDRATTARLEDGVQQVRVALAQHKSWQRQQDEMKRQRDAALALAAVHRARWQDMEQSRGQLDQQLAQARDTAALVVALKGIVLVQDRVINSLKRENMALYAALAISQAQADSAAARVAQLERASAQLLKSADCHIMGLGFLPRCPSRTTSLIIGAAGGAAVVLFANK